MMVKRYEEWFSHGESGISEEKDGSWVKYEDYAELETELNEAKEEIKKLENSVCHAMTSRAELEKVYSAYAQQKIDTEKSYRDQAIAQRDALLFSLKNIVHEVERYSPPEDRMTEMWRIARNAIASINPVQKNNI